MKKIVRIVAIALGVILLLLLMLPFLFKSRISSFVKEQVNQSVHATVDWNRIGLTFFRGFPDLSVNLHDVSVVGLDVFEGDTLVALQRFEFRVNPFSALRNEIQVKSILLDKPLINGIVLEDGTANWDIAVPPGETVKEKAAADVPSSVPEEKKKKDTETPEGDGAPSMSVSLERFAIMNGRILYNDSPGEISASIGDFDLEIRGNFAMENTDAELSLAIDGIQAELSGIRYMREGFVGLEVLASADMVNNVFTLKKNEIRINGLTLGAEGSVTMHDDGGLETDLQFFTKETSFATLLSMVPALYLQDFETLETSGSLALNGTVKGMLKDSLLPDATLNLLVSDGFFSYPDVPKDVSDVQIDLHVDYRGTDMDLTTVQLKRFHLLLGGNPFDMQLNVAHPFTDMQVAGLVKGNIDFSTLADVIPMEEINLQGRMETDLSWDTRMSYIENEQFEQVNLDGRLMIASVQLESPDIPVPVGLEKLELVFTPRFVELTSLDLLMGSSDLHLDGRLTNFIPYVFEGKTVSGSLAVRSELIDASELIPAAEPAGEQESDPLEHTEPQEEAVTADSLAGPAPLKIPENIDFALLLDMKKIIYDEIVVENLTGDMEVRNGVALMDGLRLEVLEGSVSVSGEVDTRDEYTAADLSMDIRQINIPASYETFVTVEKLAPVAKYCEGNANVEIDLETLLDASFSPLYESINADGHLYARNLKIEQTETLVRLGQALNSEKLNQLELEKADFRFRVRDGRVVVDPFDVAYRNSMMTVSGSHGIDMTMDYLLDMEIAKSDLGAGANELMDNLGALAAGAGVPVPQSETLKVKASITGTFTDPKIRTDLSGNFKSTTKIVREAVEERVKEEVEKVEEQVRDEAGKKAEELIREAEAKKAELVRQAESAGDRLVKEAENQGEQLIKDAGSNPLKRLAAEKAAQKLVDEAKKKSDQLVEEAEAKGDALIQKAREEAGRI